MAFHHQDPALLNGRVTFHYAKTGSVLARQGDQVLILKLFYLANLRSLILKKQILESL